MRNLNKNKIFLLHSSTATVTAFKTFVIMNIAIKPLLFTMFMHHKFMNKSDNHSVNLISKITKLQCLCIYAINVTG